MKKKSMSLDAFVKACADLLNYEGITVNPTAKRLSIRHEDYDAPLCPIAAVYLIKTGEICQIEDRETARFVGAKLGLAPEDCNRIVDAADFIKKEPKLRQRLKEALQIA